MFGASGPSLKPEYIPGQLIKSEPEVASVACYGPMGFAMSFFMLSKFPELLDTFFLVVMSKRVSFLHWYHHITVLLYSWFAYHNATPSAVLFGTMNYLVHSMMYFYFGVSTYTEKLSFLRQPITTLQILQMGIGVGVTVIAYEFSSMENGQCSETYERSGFFFFCLLLYGSYLGLFVKLYFDNYLVGRKKRGAIKKDHASAAKNLGSSTTTPESSKEK